MAHSSVLRAGRSLALALALAAPACGQERGGGGAEPYSPAQEKRAVERAAIEYVEETSRDEDDPESAGALDVTAVILKGDLTEPKDAEARATSSATENRYRVTLTRSTGTWQGTGIVTDRPEKKKPFGSRNPAEGPGQVVSTDSVEKEIRRKLLKPLKLTGRVSCPPRVAVRKGNNFECRIVGGVLKGSVRVTQRNDRGRLKYKLAPTGA